MQYTILVYETESLGRAGPARDAYDRAIGLSEEPAVREFLMVRSADVR